jgi:hypothetical protein
MSNFIFRSGFTLSAAALVVVLLASAHVFARQTPAGGAGKGAGQKAAAAPGDAQEKRPWTLRMSKDTPPAFSLKAKEARLGEIVEELGRLTKTQVFVSPLLAKEQVSLEFSGMPLEAVLRMFAPQVYVDYEVGGGQEQPKALAVYLQALNEKPPSTSQVVKGTSEAILIEGDTEEGTGDEEAQRKRDEENPLKVSYARNNLSVRARKQPLTVVLFKIAGELGIPFELRHESPEVVDVDFSNYTVEQALRNLSPAVRLFYRTDLQTFDVQPLRIVLAQPAAKS